ncbi:MAG: CDP-alcohol phosphatidyltransferase family protein [Candidatus Aenigmatarchaeota archaeon]
MTFYGKRHKFEGVSQAVGKAFRMAGLPANTITLLSIIPALASAYLITQSEFILAAALFMLCAILDMADGAVARATGKASNFGAYLDTMMDRYVEFIVILSLLFLSLSGGIPGLMLPAAVWVFVLLFGSLMTSYAKAAAKEKNLVRDEIKGGLVERAERMLILFTGIILASVNPLYLTYAIVLLAFLSNITALQRAWIAKRSAA